MLDHPTVFRNLLKTRTVAPADHPFIIRVAVAPPKMKHAPFPTKVKLPASKAMCGMVRLLDN